METNELAVVMYRSAGFLPSDLVATVVGVFEEEQDAVDLCCTNNHFIQYVPKGQRVSSTYPSMTFTPKTESRHEAEVRWRTQCELIDLALRHEKVENDTEAD